MPKNSVERGDYVRLKETGEIFIVQKTRVRHGPEIMIFVHDTLRWRPAYLFGYIGSGVLAHIDKRDLLKVHGLMTGPEILDIDDDW